ncbi:MAG: cytochrome c family protein [Syntrophorhabdaceae bacterium]|nr:cytochrome c family protein [Syntrophorhabdaceae bacterium]
MKSKTFISMVFLFVSLGLVFSFTLSYAQKKPAEPMMLKLEGAKMAPTKFSHDTHVEKEKIDCAKCHHKDKDPKQPEGCVGCHPVKEAKGDAPAAKDAFHKMCTTCHKEVASKGKAAPTKCNECHKK